MVVEANAQALINVSRVRLCYQAANETREYMEDLKDSIYIKDKNLSNVLVPNCVYRGGGGYAMLMTKAGSDTVLNIGVGKGGRPYNDPTEYYQLNYNYGFGENGKDGMVVIYDYGELNPTIANILPTSTVLDGTYTVVRGFNLADEFKRVTGRLPIAGDIIDLTVPANWALVGSTDSPAGITIDDRCSVATSINITNNGIISGIGGNGGSGTLVPTAGGRGIHNTSTKTVTVRNYGTIAGGGGGAGSAFLTFWGGGGGAPYGKGAARTGVSYPEADGKDAVLLVAGESGYYQSTSNSITQSKRNGPGGLMGVAGPTSPDANSASAYGAVAGLIKEGNVTITNIDSGITKGR